MLFDSNPFRSPVPKNVSVFASGSNRVAEIRGFSKLGIPVGVSVNHLNETAIQTLIDLGQPVLVDSGAFSEVSFEHGELHVVAPISHADWQKRLAIYLRLAESLGEKALIVAPDQVGNQQETLKRLSRYRDELGKIARTGAILLLPLQVGELSHAEFFREAVCVAGVPLTPAATMKKASTSNDALIEFLQQVKPTHLHLLGIGIENRRAGRLIRILRHYAPEVRLTLDSNRLRATTGKHRSLTMKEAELRECDMDDLYGAVDSPVLAATGELLDYTDLIAMPSLWASNQDLRNIAVAAGFSMNQAAAFLNDPDNFLQQPWPESEEIAWIEHPLTSAALDRYWVNYAAARVRSSVRTAAIISVFAGSHITSH